MWVPRIGERVDTRGFGPGEVDKLVADGVLVALEKFGLKVKLPLDQLIPLEPEPATEAKETPNVSTVLHPRRGDFAPRRAVEAMRFGLVPEQFIDKLTLGYHELRLWVLDRFPHAHSGKPQVSQITGPFGTGKSHIMAVIRHLAREEGYVTARVEVDGQNISLSEPERLLSSVWASLSAKDLESSTPLLDIYIKAIRSGYDLGTVRSFGLERINTNFETIHLLNRRGLLDKYGYAMDSIISSSNEFTASEVKRMINQDVSAYEYDVKRMIGLAVKGRPFDFMESIVGNTLVAKLAGYKGLVLTIDEFEVEHNLTKQKLDRVARLLVVLSTYLSGKLEGFPAAPLAIFIATVGQEGHVGDALVDDYLVDKAGGANYSLHPWERDRRLDLAERIHRLYCDAYGVDAPFDRIMVDEIEAALDVQSTDSGLIRAFIKRYVASLDAAYGPPVVA